MIATLLFGVVLTLGGASVAIAHGGDWATAIHVAGADIVLTVILWGWCRLRYRHA